MHSHKRDGHMGKWGGWRVRWRVLGFSFVLLAVTVISLLWATKRLDANRALRLLGGCAGLVPGVVWPPHGNTNLPPQGWCRRASVWVIAVCTAYFAAHPFFWYHDPGYTNERKWVNAIADLLVGAVATASVATNHPPSSYTRDAVRCVVGIWLRMVIWSAAPALRNYREGDVLSTGDLVAAFLSGFGNHFEGVLIFVWTASLMARRLKAMDGRDSFVARSSELLIVSMGVSYQCLTTVLATSMRQLTWTRLAWHLGFMVFFISIWVVYSVLLIRRFVSNLKMLKREAKALPKAGAARTEARWAVKVVRVELVACVVLAVTTTLTWSTLTLAMVAKQALQTGTTERPWAPPQTVTLVPGKGYAVGAPGAGTEWGGRGGRPGASREVHLADPRVREIWFVEFCVHRVDLLVNAVSIAVLSGLLWQVRKPKLERKDVDAKPGGRSCLPMAGHGPEWHAKVEELAGRGVELGDLLRFWHALLFEGTMPHFDPKRSTTNDVVRQAIIPMSRNHTTGGGSALAVRWSGGCRRLADCMVTHNWSNLFWHLVAAIVADSLGEACYEGVADQLVTAAGFLTLTQAVLTRGADKIVYWVCAFSINQHAGICSGFGAAPPPGTAQREDWESKTRDTVTGDRFSLCECSEPKVFNNEPALCEMNKFDDMMRLLKAEMGGAFTHLIVVDADFEVFSRAWCVAEIVEGDLSIIPQRILIHSPDMLDVHYESLSFLDVRGCNASRAEDKEMILQNIGDIDAFNRQLQWSIFGTKGLFSNWMDGQERAALIRRILKRASRSSLSVTQSTSVKSTSSASSGAMSKDSRGLPHVLWLERLRRSRAFSWSTSDVSTPSVSGCLPEEADVSRRVANDLEEGHRPRNVDVVRLESFTELDSEAAPDRPKEGHDGREDCPLSPSQL